MATLLATPVWLSADVHLREAIRGGIQQEKSSKPSPSISSRVVHVNVSAAGLARQEHLSQQSFETETKQIRFHFDVSPHAGREPASKYPTQVVQVHRPTFAAPMGQVALLPVRQGEAQATGFVELVPGENHFDLLVRSGPREWKTPVVVVYRPSLTPN